MKYKTGGQKELEVSEAFATYLKELRKTEKLKKELSLHDFFSNRMLVVRSIQKGIPFSLFHRIREVTPFTDTEWADFLNISVKSLQRYSSQRGYRFKPIHSEKILELAEIANLGREVFDSAQQFHLWLITPSFALGKMKPIELLKNSYGKEIVMDELNRIDHGIFA